MKSWQRSVPENVQHMLIDTGALKGEDVRADSLYQHEKCRESEDMRAVFPILIHMGGYAAMIGFKLRLRTAAALVRFIPADALVLEEVFREEEDVGGAFGEAAHEVGVPLRAEGDVDADAVALGGELALEVAADAVEHLELEGVLVDLVLVDEVAHLVDDGFVVGGDAAEDAMPVRLV